jgi:endo-1,4-beta-xylanase
VRDIQWTRNTVARRVASCAGALLMLGAALAATAQPASPGAPAPQQRKFLGNIIAAHIPPHFNTYWNQITPENSGKWESVEPVRNQMNWTSLDLAYQHARTHGFPFKQHTFVWGSQEPRWIGDLSDKQQAREVEEFMRLYCKRYPDTQFIDVVNEPLSKPPSYAEALGGVGKTGWDWVIWSFEKARKHCPSAKLFINDYSIIDNAGRLGLYVGIVELLKARGLIDGVGIQAHHFSMDNVSTATTRANLDTLAKTGLPIHVSELDMTGDDDTQLARYREKFPVLWTHPAVTGVTLWGYIEGQTWKPGTYLVQEDDVERPSMVWLKDYVRRNPQAVTIQPSRGSAPAGKP